MSPDSGGTRRQWTIYVCDKCGDYDAGEFVCECGPAREVVVVEAQAADRLAEALERIARLDVPREGITGLVPAIERFARSALSGFYDSGEEKDRWVATGVVDPAVPVDESQLREAWHAVAMESLPAMRTPANASESLARIHGIAKGQLAAPVAPTPEE